MQRFCTAALLLLVVIVGLVECTPNRPQIYPQFQSMIELYSSTMPLGSAASPGFYAYDRTNSRITLNANIPFIISVPQGLEIVEKVLLLPKGEYFMMNGVCRNNNLVHFVDPFAWLVNATYVNTQVLFGVSCDLWSFNDTAKNVAHSIYVSHADPNIPVYLSTVSISSGKGQNIHYKNLQVVAPSPSLFDIPERCNYDYICPGGSVDVLPIYRFHSGDDYSLANHNSADLYGDASFLCLTLVPDKHQVDTLISLYQVQMNTSYGMYGFCNAGFCLGGSKKLVGREASLGMKPYAGQCLNNTFMGNWYSLTSSGECKSNKTIGQNCSWKTLSRDKTISADCLRDQGFVQACLQDQTIPLYNSKAVMEKAFQVCPDIPPSSGQEYMKMKKNVVDQDQVQWEMLRSGQMSGLFNYYYPEF